MTIRISGSRIARALLLAVLADPTWAWTQEPIQGFADTFDVNLVEVDVLVTDRQGQPVTDLAWDDFRLYEDGELIELTNFYTVRNGRRPSESPELSDSPEPVYLAIYVDDLNLSVDGRDRALVQIENFVVRELRPVDRAMVVVSGAQPRIVNGLTNDFDALAKTLSELRGKVSRGGAIALDRRTILSAIGGNNGAGASDARSILESIESYAQTRFDLIHATVSFLEELMADLGGIPGRKALLYVGDNLPNRPGEQLLQAWEARFASQAPDIGMASIVVQADRYDTDRLFTELVEKANMSRVTFYAIGVAEESAMDAGGPALGLSVGLRGAEQVLGFLGEATGGRSYVGRSSAGLLRLLRQDFDSYYSLGYAQPEQLAEGEHRIEVRIEGRKGLRVRHRDRYQARSRADRTADRTRTALVLGVAENPIGLALELDPATAADQAYRIPILVKIPLSEIVLVPQGDFHAGSITVFVSARDGRGRVSKVQRFQFPIRLPNDRMSEARGQVAGYRVSLLLRAEEHEIAVGVQDDLGVASAVIRTRWAPGETGVTAATGPESR